MPRQGRERRKRQTEEGVGARRGPGGAPLSVTHHERDGADEHHQGGGDE